MYLGAILEMSHRSLPTRP